jgi:hypothetical protein
MVVEDRSILRHFAHPSTAGDAPIRAHVAQQAEHFLGKEEVSGSNPDVGSSTIGAPGEELARRKRAR